MSLPLHGETQSTAKPMALCHAACFTIFVRTARCATRKIDDSELKKFIAGCSKCIELFC